MSDHFFNSEVAQFAGVPQAIFIANIKHWTIINIGNKKNFINGLYWSYYTYEALQVIFPYYSKRQLEGIIEKCIELGLITKGKYNKSKWDRTNWFALTDRAYQFYPDIQKAIEKISQLTISPKGEMEDPQKGKCSFPQNGKCTNTDNIIQIETTNINESSGFVISEEIDRELLRFNQNYKMYAKDNREFLFWCKFLFDTKIKTPNMEDKIRIIKSWIKKEGLKKPTGFGDELVASPGKPTDDTDSLFRAYLASIETDKRYRPELESLMPMNKNEWILAGMPNRTDLTRFIQLPG